MQIWKVDKKILNFKKNETSKGDQMCLYGAFEVEKTRIMQVQSPKTAISAKLVRQNQKTTPPLESSGNSTQFQKKLYLKWSPDDQVMASQSRTAKLKINLVRACTGKTMC